MLYFLQFYLGDTQYLEIVQNGDNKQIDSFQLSWTILDQMYLFQFYYLNEKMVVPIFSTLNNELGSFILDTLAAYFIIAILLTFLAFLLAGIISIFTYKKNQEL
jgi:hypothetical protein